MSKIIATDSFKTKNWEMSFEELAPTYADLVISFTDDAPVVEFKDLKFKYELRQNGAVVQQNSFPPLGVKYVRSDQPYLVSERLKFKAETAYKLYLWAENNAESFETTASFTTPRPEQPYESWEWDGERWNAPVPYPKDDNGLEYYWDEALVSWTVVEDFDN